MTTQSQSQDKIERKKQKVEKAKEIFAQHQARVDANDDDRKEALLIARRLQLNHYRLEKLKEKEKDSGYENDQEEESEYEPTEEELEAVEPCVNFDKLKECDYYKKKKESLARKKEAERKARSLSKEDPAVALEKYKRAVDEQGTYRKRSPSYV